MTFGLCFQLDERRGSGQIRQPRASALWAIEDSFETPKNELGLDHNETRSWHGWHRHVALVMLAFAMMAVIRHRANVAPRLKKTMHLPRTNHRS